jgi:ABC-type polysaccharide/polyol phosphate export permease
VKTSRFELKIAGLSDREWVDQSNGGVRHNGVALQNGNDAKVLMLSKSINDLKRGILLYPTWLHQAYHEVSSKYKRTVLGSLWISGGMVATSLALAIVMGGIQGQDLPDILPYVMGGIIAYALSGYVMSEAPELFMSAAPIIKNHAYPFTYYSFESITRTFIIFLHNIVVYYIVTAMLMKLTVPHWSILFALVLVYFNSAIWGSLMAMLAARFRDMRFMLPFLSQIVFFITPVFWHPGNLKGWRTTIIQFNPFYGLMEIVRSPLLGQAAPMVAWAQSVTCLAVGALLWLVFFSRFRSKIAFWV